MNLSDNIKKLRAARGMSQEQLANKLDVSRQAVSRWESGDSFPEMDKVLKMRELFDVPLDALVEKADLAVGNTDSEKAQYESVHNKFAVSIAAGVGMIIMGVALTTALASPENDGNNVQNIVSSMFVLLGVLLAVPIFIYQGIRYSGYKRRHHGVSALYSEQDVTDFHSKFALLVSGGVALIIAGVIFVSLMYGLEVVSQVATWPSAIFLSLIAVAVSMFVYGGIQKHKYDCASQDRKTMHELSSEQRKSGKISGVIMLTATMVFLFLGFLFDMWSTAWVVFPLCGILCGIVSTIFDHEDHK